MGFEIEIINGKRYYVKDKIKIRIQAWQPDISYDQMHMMIDRLKEEGARLQFIWNKKEWIVSIYTVQFDSLQEHKNIRTAFRLACTEYKTAK